MGKQVVAAKPGKDWNLLWGSNMIKYHHWHWRQLADLMAEPKRCSQGQIHTTALEMKVFTYFHPTYGSWEAISVISHGEWMHVNLHLKLSTMQLNCSKRKKEQTLPLTSFTTTLVQRLEALSPVLSTLFLRITPHMLSCFHKLQESEKYSPFLGGGGYNDLLLFQQIPLN